MMSTIYILRTKIHERYHKLGTSQDAFELQYGKKDVRSLAICRPIGIQSRQSTIMGKKGRATIGSLPRSSSL